MKLENWISANTPEDKMLWKDALYDQVNSARNIARLLSDILPTLKGGEDVTF